MKNRQFIKKFTGDFLLNFIATFLVTAMLQFMIYPLINHILGNIVYGDFLTIIGIVNTLSALVGSSLNNVRLIKNNDYERKHILGDFNILLLISSIIVVVISFFVFSIYFDMNYGEAVGVAALIFLLSGRSYWAVAYRIVLDYKKILLSNIFLAAGYLTGCVLVHVTKMCIFAYIVGEVICIIYIMQTTRIIKEPFCFTPMIRGTLKDYGAIGLSTLSANIMIYLDRLILHPLLGGEAVTIYTIASLGGKYLGMVVTPLAGVLLSYYTQSDFIMTRKKYLLTSFVCIILCFCSLMVINPIAPVIAEILYPNAYEEALPLIGIANVGGILVVINNMIQPAFLKAVPTFWQLIKEVFYAVCYILLGIYFLNSLGLWGFCIANIISTVAKIFLIIIVGTFYCTKNGDLGVDR